MRGEWDQQGIHSRLNLTFHFDLAAIPNLQVSYHDFPAGHKYRYKSKAPNRFNLHTIEPGSGGQKSLRVCTSNTTRIVKNDLSSKFTTMDSMLQL